MPPADLLTTVKLQDEKVNIQDVTEGETKHAREKNQERNDRSNTANQGWPGSRNQFKPEYIRLGYILSFWSFPPVYRRGCFGKFVRQIRKTNKPPVN